MLIYAVIALAAAVALLILIARKARKKAAELEELNDALERALAAHSKYTKKVSDINEWRLKQNETALKDVDAAIAAVIDANNARLQDGASPADGDASAKAKKGSD